MLRKTPGRIILSITAILSAVLPIRADWNDSHVFSPLWTGHARFHGVTFLGSAVIHAVFALWILWRRTPDRDMAALVGAMAPLAYWVPFYIAALVPGTALFDPGHPIPQPLGIPANILSASGNIIGALTGLLVYWRVDRRRAEGG